MDIRNTTARLRRTFHYPTDESSNGGTPEVLDEEEQEDLIQALAEQNATTNRQYKNLLLALPTLSTIPYLIALFRPATFLIALLGLSSLASTAYLLFSLPPTETGIALFDTWARSGDTGPGRRGIMEYEDEEGDDDGNNNTATTSTTSSTAFASGSGSVGGGQSGLGALDQRQRRRRRRTSSLTYQGPRSPLERYLPFLNLGLCAVLILYGLSAGQGDEGEGDDGSGQHHHHFGLLGLGNLPAIIYLVVIIAKVVMASVDPESELAALRYEYKGA